MESTVALCLLLLTFWDNVKNYPLACLSTLSAKGDETGVCCVHTQICPALHPFQSALPNPLCLHRPWSARGTLELPISCREGELHLCLCLPPDCPLPGGDLEPSLLPTRFHTPLDHQGEEGGLDSSSLQSGPTSSFPQNTWPDQHLNSTLSLSSFPSSSTLRCSIIHQVPSVTSSIRFFVAFSLPLKSSTSLPPTPHIVTSHHNLKSLSPSTLASPVLSSLPSPEQFSLLSTEEAFSTLLSSLSSSLVSVCPLTSRPAQSSPLRENIKR